MSAYTDADLRAAIHAANDREPCANDRNPHPIDQCAMRAALDAVASTIAARAWDEGHATHWQREMDDCRCGAWNRGECGCGKYGTGRLITPNPYRTP